MVSGLTTMPDSNFLTWRTWAACASGSRLRWMTPMPPACAMAMAICASVTVSMAEAMIGILSGIERVMRVRISTSAGSTSDRPGLISTSSKVSASRGLPLFFGAIANSISPKGVGAGDRGLKNARGEGDLARLHGPLLGWRGSVARSAGQFLEQSPMAVMNPHGGAPASFSCRFALKERGDKRPWPRRVPTCALTASFR